MKEEHDTVFESEQVLLAYHRDLPCSTSFKMSRREAVQVVLRELSIMRMKYKKLKRRSEKGQILWAR